MDRCRFQDVLSKSINHNIFIDNDANNLAIAEQWFGIGDVSDNFIVIMVENGVGAGCVVNGHLMRGHLGLAGEFGHLIIDSDGPFCKCGSRGCLGAYVGIDGILIEAEKIAGRGIWNTERKRRISFDDVLKELEEGNSELEKVYTRAGEVLGLGISHLIKLFEPEKIIVTGDGIRAGDHLLAPMFESLPELLSNNLVSYKTDVIAKRWTDEAWARGAGTLVLQEIYKSPAVK